jgi:hypothetical protein
MHTPHYALVRFRPLFSVVHAQLEINLPHDAALLALHGREFKEIPCSGC